MLEGVSWPLQSNSAQFLEWTSSTCIHRWQKPQARRFQICMNDWRHFVTSKKLLKSSQSTHQMLECTYHWLVFLCTNIRSILSEKSWKSEPHLKQAARGHDRLTKCSHGLQNNCRVDVHTTVPDSGLMPSVHASSLSACMYFCAQCCLSTCMSRLIVLPKKARQKGGACRSQNRETVGLHCVIGRSPCSGLGERLGWRSFVILVTLLLLPWLACSRGYQCTTTAAS